MWGLSIFAATTGFCLLFLSSSVSLLALGAAAEVSWPLCLQKTPDPLQMEVAKG